jgi:hypothetical protein
MIEPIRILPVNNKYVTAFETGFNCKLCNKQLPKNCYVVERFDFKLGMAGWSTLQEIACSRECAEMIMLQNI